MISKLLTLSKKHKVTSGLIILIVLVSGYYGYKTLFTSSASTRYVTAAAEKGTLVVSVSASGQVSATNQIDVKPKSSGDITGVYVKVGDSVTTGALLATLDTSDAERAVRDAETSLETAKLEYDKLVEPLDALTLFQTDNSLLQAQEAKQNAADNIDKAYEDGFNSISNAFLQLPDTITGLQSILFSSDLLSGVWNIDYYYEGIKDSNDGALKLKTNAVNSYKLARDAYDANLLDYKSTSRNAATSTIESLINETYATSKLIADAVKNSDNLIRAYQDAITTNNRKLSSISTTHLSNLSSYTSSANSQISSLLSAQNAIKNSKGTFVNATRALDEKILSVAKTKAGPDDLTIRASKITIQQKQDALTTAKQNLADRYIRSLFAGVVAKVNAKKGDAGGTGTAVATVVTKQKIAEVTLNEVDIAKVKVGQKTTITFDAIPDLSITGEVSEVDSIGTVSQGVVTYTVKITFDTQDDRVKPSMSASAAIITDVKQDVLLVPNSAIKSDTSGNYVQILTNGLPTQKVVRIGLANDTITEIISGINEGDQVVTQSITSTATAATTGQSSGIRIPGVTGGGGFKGN